MNRSLKVSDIMWNHIAPVRLGTSLQGVVRHLLQNHVTGLPVVDEDRKVVGFVSEQDCIHTLLVHHYHGEGEPSVDDVMKRQPLTITPGMSVVDLAQNLGHDKPKVYPVEDQGQLVGIVTRTAILAELAGIEVSRYLDTD